MKTLPAGPTVANPVVQVPFLRDGIDRIGGIVAKFSFEGKIGLLGLALILLVAIFAPWISLYPHQKLPENPLKPPTAPTCSVPTSSAWTSGPRFAMAPA